ncbi:MAG: Ig-like domain-containing protein [Paludibacteraceae bacterium]|nr:Ig-like domain-containing protein [Paludibacteraceae bacterium]
MKHYSLLVCLLLIAGCANRGIGPQGGPKDEKPPQVVKESPENGTLNYNGKRVDIVFNEYIQLDDVSKNVLISPPQQHPPEVKAVGKKIMLVFEEPLQDSTTYTIDFGNAIGDFHEKNVLKGYTLSFSTCDVIDSLEVNGYIVNAEDLNPVSGVIIGIHANLDDTAFSKIPFTRVGKTDQNGHFYVKNIREADYRIYGLGDVSRDFIYQPGEGLAFTEDIIHPYCHTELEGDTVWRDTIDIVANDSLGYDTIATRVVDTIRYATYTYYEPNDVILWYFNEDKTRHYFQRCFREKAHFFRLQFAAPQDSLPVVRALRPSEVDSTKSDSAWVDWMDYALLQHSSGNDTIIYWLTDSSVIKQDTLYMEMTYMKSDSLYNLVTQTDTVLAVYRAPRVSEKAKALMEKNKKPPVLAIQSNASAGFDVYKDLILSMPTPVKEWVSDSLHLFHKIDTVYKPLRFSLEPVDSAYLQFRVVFPWKPEQQYELRIDSAAFYDVYGVTNKAGKHQLQLKSLDEYSTLTVKLSTYDDRARLQLLDKSEKIIKELPASRAGTKFEYISPNTYYLRLYIDENEDGKWTTGDWATHRQPEPVYYFPSKLQLRANWEFEEDFDFLAVPQIDSKPQELLQDVANKKK